jgi:hypothetical protein
VAGGRQATGVASGRGFACAACESDNSYVAMAADVDVNRSTGVVHGWPRER